MRADPIPALKQQLGNEIARELTGWRASDICGVIGTDAARVSDLRRGRLERFSLERLIRFATRLGRRVDLAVVVANRERRSLPPEPGSVGNGRIAVDPRADAN